MEQADKRKALGKGLSALLPARVAAASRAETVENGLKVLRVADIDPNPLQPRSIFDPTKLRELADSILANGIVQPLIVRKQGDRYELIAGERRLRAAKLAEIESVPAIIQDYADARLLELAIVENLQREDLNPVETAQALERLGRELNLSHEEIGRRTGKDRTTITNLIRLLKLPADVQLLLAEHRLSMGHARAILGLPTPDLQREVADRSAAQGYSVRQVERIVQDLTKERTGGGMKDSSQATTPLQDPNVASAVRDLEEALGTRVRIVEKSPERGRIEIDYFSQDDLNRVYETIVRGRE